MKRFTLVLLTCFVLYGCREKQPEYTISYSNPAPMQVPQPQTQTQQVDIIYPTPTQDVVYDNVTVVVPQPQQSEVYTLPPQNTEVYNITDIETKGAITGTRNNIGFQLSVMPNPSGNWWNVSWSCVGDTSKYTEIVIVDKTTSRIVGVGNILPRGSRKGGFNFPMALISQPSNMKVIIR